MDRRALGRRLEGLEPVEERKVGKRTERLYRLADVFAHLHSDERLDLNAERAKLAVLQQERIRIELGEKRGELISAKATVAHWQSMLGEVRGRLLALPNRAAPIVARKDEGQIFAVLNDLVYEALHGLARSAIPPDIEERIKRYQEKVA
jgi:hypothetical protein